ncbi:MAG: response regulator [Desulfobacterales bacterium]|nr:response regulator [Desulfobacterales bacterium]
MPHQMGNFKINNRMMRYSSFIPRLFNLCLSYGFEPGRIMPSRAFCSDENQGIPIILIAKHFGAFPFNHGRVGGIVAAGRHSPHAHHGKDLVIIQASHVGYDEDSKQFGVYRRLQIEGPNLSHSCGKICGVLTWYLKEYEFAQNNILLSEIDGQKVVIIDNQLIDPSRKNGLFLNMNHFIATDNHQKPGPGTHVFSTSKAFRAHPDLVARMPAALWREDQKTPLGKLLTSDLFHFKREIQGTPDKENHLEYNLSFNMPHIVTTVFPALSAAMANTQIEFDRTYRTITKEHKYQGRNLVFISGINIDISPKDGQVIPLTKFVPWAAFIQTEKGLQVVMEQDELLEALHAESAINPFQINLDEAIYKMAVSPKEVIIVDDEKEFAKALSDRLHLRDIDVSISYDGADALKRIQEHPAEVMILDLKMPGIDGVEVLRQVKKSSPETEVIIITGHGSDADRQTCLDLGAFAFLQKPLDIEELETIINAANSKVQGAEA